LASGAKGCEFEPRRAQDQEIPKDTIATLPTDETWELAIKCTKPRTTLAASSLTRLSYALQKA